MAVRSRSLEGVVMSADFWLGKKVFLTGHTGFKGAWFSLWLKSLGAEVTGFALPPNTTPSLFEIASVGDGITSIMGDVRDGNALTIAMKAAQPDIVFHLAAQALVRYSYANPVETYATNVMGTVNFLEAVRAVPSIRAAVIITSDKCYENKEWLWGYRESEPMGGFDPYSSSKGCAELVTAAYRSSYFNGSDYDQHRLALGSARAGNVIGGGDWAEDRLIPDILRAIEADVPVVMRNPTSIRPWQHVLEPLSGYLHLAERLFTGGGCYSEGWNFGPQDSDARAVQWIVDRICNIWGDGATWVVNKSVGPHEANYLKLDCSKAKSSLNWESVWDLEVALEKIVQWHRAYIQGQDMRAITIEQIKGYQLASFC